MSLFQSNFRKQIRQLPKFLKSVKIIQNYSLLFIRVLTRAEAIRGEELLLEGPFLAAGAAGHVAHRARLSQSGYGTNYVGPNFFLFFRADALRIS